MKTAAWADMLRVLTGICLAICMPCEMVLAQDAQSPDYHWRNVVIGGGGYVPGVVFSPAEQGLAYIRTDMGGSYRWDQSQQHWTPLQDGNAVPSYMGIESIAPDPQDPQIVYIAAGMSAADPAAILRSTDRGAHWTIVPVPFAMGGNEPGRGLGERLAIDPNRTETLFFGSRHDGLWRSDDSGASWRKVPGFPYPGLGKPEKGKTHGGIAFVVFDPTSGKPGSGSQRIWAGLADAGADHLFRSDDGGESWVTIKGPAASFLAVKAAIDNMGQIYVAYADAIGPNDVRAGAVWRFMADGQGKDITPQGLVMGGFMGLTVARERPGTVAVSTIDRWHPGDTIWLSKNGGGHWQDLSPRSRRDVTTSPFLADEGGAADFGHWITGLAFDPFDSGHLAYTTGATIYATDAIGDQGKGDWVPWTKGIEQTAVITLASPTGGASVISGLGDIAGFVHTDLEHSPQLTFRNPHLSNTNMLDYAGMAPAMLVRSGSSHSDKPLDATLAWSEDGGLGWHPLKVPSIRTPDQPKGRRYDQDGDAAIIVSADGSTFIACIPVPLVTRDRGKSWSQAQGLDLGARPVADKVDPQRFYSVDFDTDQLLVSTDGARSFAPVAAKGLPAQLWSGRVYWREQPYRLIASPVAAGDLWFNLGEELYHSLDGGKNWTQSSGRLKVEIFGLGKSAPNGKMATIFAIGTLGEQRGVWRSVDGGRNWLRINDEAHQWGLRFRVISGDPRRFGRVYIGTDGRGLVYGDPVERQP